MKVISAEIKNIMCFKHELIQLATGINVIVGPNNNGKTCLLNCISDIQNPHIINSNSKRINTDKGEITINFDHVDIQGQNQNINAFKISTDRDDINAISGNSTFGRDRFPNTEPGNFIIPYQSKRKVGGYKETVSSGIINQVTGTLENLYAKIDRISNSEYQPAHDEYTKACDEILGFRVTTTHSVNGKKAVYIIRNDLDIPIDRMGEGVSSLLGLIVDLCRVENKLFIIEEPENDIHPKALKKLLDLIIQKSKSNQFVITTHSNIVLRHLGSAENSKVFNIEMTFEDRIPTSIINVIDTPEKRKIALEELGYELYDFDLWEYWIIFEESSAERIVREFLIPWFIPELLNKARTFSARSLSQVVPKFEDFNRLFVFLHLQEIYKNKAWIIVDGGENESQIIHQLITTYEPSGWHKSNFRQFSKHDFEEYYPSRFQDKVKLIGECPEKKTKMGAKKELLNEVINFIKQNDATAKKEFKESAAEVIELMKKILE